MVLLVSTATYNLSNTLHISYIHILFGCCSLWDFSMFWLFLSLNPCKPLAWCSPICHRPSWDLQVCTRHLASLHQQVQHLRILQQQVQHFDMFHYFLMHPLAAGMSLCKGSSTVSVVREKEVWHDAFMDAVVSSRHLVCGRGSYLVTGANRIESRNLQNTQGPQLKRRLVSSRFSSYRPNSYRHNKLSKLFRRSQCMVWYSTKGHWRLLEAVCL